MTLARRLGGVEEGLAGEVLAGHLQDVARVSSATNMP